MILLNNLKTMVRSSAPYKLLLPLASQNKNSHTVNSQQSTNFKTSASTEVAQFPSL